MLPRLRSPCTTRRWPHREPSPWDRSRDVAIGRKPVDKVKALILLSYGIGGSELGHSVLAQALARNDYLVAALRHPGDNWQD